MTSWWPPVVLLSLVALLLILSRYAKVQSIFQWLPIPLWCYGVPMILRAIGALPAHHASYVWLTDHLLPLALALLLLGVDLVSLSRVGVQALVAMAVGALGIVGGGPLMLWLVHSHLPPDAWKGIGALAATWTGGSLNMLAVRAILEIPDSVFAPLVVVDALVAYSWMALLVACKGLTPALNRWLRAADHDDNPGAVSSDIVTVSQHWSARVACAAVAVGLAWICRLAAQSLPIGGLIASGTGWAVLLVSSVALGLSCVPAIRQLGQHSSTLGYPCLYVVLAALGAQASLKALATTPVWILVGFGCVVFHGAMLLVAGRVFRIPLGILATASQANVGGVVSAPLVGAVYQQALAPVGLLLAIAGNAVGTYLGLFAAFLGRLLAG